jgi:NAD(P)H dehydrogenase (quinone)
MKFLIVYAHPESKGFSSAFLEQAQKILKEKSQDFEVLDLYKIGYDPVLKLDELYTAGNKNVSLQNQNFQQKIKNADRLIFIYPVWWGNMPAILKGFMDRVFTPGFAFKYRANKLLKFIPDKLLDDKKFAVFTSCGGPKFVYKLLLDPIKLVNKFIVFGLFCSKTKTYQIYSAGRMNNKRNNEIIKITEKGVNWLLK